MGIIGLFLVSFPLAFYPYDFYANDLELPTNIKLHKPISYFDNNEVDKNLDFKVSDSFQKGLFFYSIYLGKIEKGKIYLKAFEITTNDPLSIYRLSRKSTIEVENKTNNLKLYKLDKHFTIHEGDWGQPYAVRFEVWFKNDKETKSVKLTEKNYVIEGWQR